MPSMLPALRIGSGADAVVMSASAFVSTLSSADAVGADGMAGIVGSVLDALDAISSLSLSPSALLSAPLSLALSVGFAVTFVSAVTTDGLAASVADVPTGEAATGEMMVDVRDTLPDDDKVAGDGIGRKPGHAGC